MGKGHKKKSTEKIIGEIAVGVGIAGLVIAASASKKGHHHHHHKSESLAERRRREADEQAERQAREDRTRQQLLERQTRERIQRLERENRENQQREERLERARLEQARLADEAQAHQRVLEAYPHVSDSTLNSLSILTASQSCAPSHVDGKTLPYLALEQGHIEAFVALINVKKYKANLEQAPYRNPLEQLILRADAVEILEKIRPTVALCSRTLFALIKSKFDQSMIVTLMSSWPSIDPILIWMIQNQLLPQEGIDFLNQKATSSIIKNHFDVYHALFEKYDFTNCSTEVRISYLTQHVAQKGKLQVKQLKTLYCKNKNSFDIGLLYDDLLCIPGQTPDTVLAMICELHKINQYPLMTFSHSFFRKHLSSHIAEAEKILNIMFNKGTKSSDFYLSAQTIESIIVIASQVIVNKRQCAHFLMPLVTVAAKNNISKSILIELAQHMHDLSFSNRLLSALPDFENLSDLRRALLPELLADEPDYQRVLQRWYVKNNTYYVKEMHEDFEAINKGEMTLPMIKHFIQNKACSIEIDRELFPIIDGNYDIICDLARLDNKVTLKRYLHCIPANNIEYKMALFYQFSNAFNADDYYQLFRNYIDVDQFYSQYQYIESLLKNPQALLETLGPVTQHRVTANQPTPSAPPLIPLATLATAVYATDHSTNMTAPIYAVAMPYQESLDIVHDVAQQKESHQLNPSAEERHVVESEQQEKPLVAQKLLLAFAKVSLEKITSPEAIMTLTRQLKNDWITYPFIQSSIDLMYQWAKISLLFLEIYQTNGQVNQQIMQFMKEDVAPPEKGFAGAWKSTMSAIGLSNNKYTLFYTAICSTNKVGSGALNMEKLVTEQRNVAMQLDKALQPGSL